MEDAKYGSVTSRKPWCFKLLPSPYFLRAVRSFREYGAERDEIRATCHFGGQELFAKKAAIIGDFGRSVFGERDLSIGRMAERETAALASA
jgi:hypothetical protein